MDQEKLFAEFPPIATQTWEELITKDLKGADYTKKLVWHTMEGFDVRPYYREEDLQKISYLDSMPNEFPFVRGSHTENNVWKITQEINMANPIEANGIAKKAIAKGANILAFNAQQISSQADMEQLLADIDLEKIGIQFFHANSYIALMGHFIEYVQQQKYDKNQITGSIDFDPIMFFLKNGKFFYSQEEDITQAIQLLILSKELPQFRIIQINGLAMHNAGATIVQELGYSLGIANEYLAFLTDRGITVEEAASKMGITLSVGANYFMEIAKLRAIRLLWATFVEQYHPKTDDTCKLYIQTVASSWNKTIYDPHVNILRTTTEGMAAALGGADSINLKPFDVAYKESDDFSQRICRNIQVILKEESYFDKVADPSAGSYYIENLTDSIADHAWQLFQQIEQEGGIITAITQGVIRTNIEKSCQQRDMDIATRKHILLGTNQYPNITEEMLDKIEQTKSCEVTALKSYRGAQAFEEVRMATERYARQHGKPKVFLLKMGNLTMRQARAGFITNFFGCAGYEIIETSGYRAVEEGVNDALKSNAAIIALCSSDEEYATIGIECVKKIRENSKNSIIVVAGNPIETIEELKSAGANDFIHVKTNVLESLQQYNSKICNS